MLKIYPTDERLIVYDDNRKIWDSFPGVVIENNKPVDFISSEEEYNNDNRRIILPFRGGVIASYRDAEWLLRKAIKRHKKLRPYCRLAVSPNSGGIELRAMQDWYRKWYDKKLPQLVYEPIAFLYGMNLSNGTVLTQRSSMIELSIVRDKKIIEYYGCYWDYDCKHKDKVEIANYIDAKIEKFLKDSKCLDNSLPIYFTSYKELTDLSHERFNKYQIKRIDYDCFCLSIINGLGSDNIPLIKC